MTISLPGCLSGYVSVVLVFVSALYLRGVICRAALLGDCVRGVPLEELKEEMGNVYGTLRSAENRLERHIKSSSLFFSSLFLLYHLHISGPNLSDSVSNFLEQHRQSVCSQCVHRLVEICVIFVCPLELVYRER